MKGSNPRIDHALEHLDGINGFLRQDMNDSTGYPETVKKLVELLP